MRLLSFRKFFPLEIDLSAVSMFEVIHSIKNSDVRELGLHFVLRYMYLALKLNKVKVHTSGSYIHNKTSKELQLKQQTYFSQSYIVAKNFFATFKKIKVYCMHMVKSILLITFISMVKLCTSAVYPKIQN